MAAWDSIKVQRSVLDDINRDFGHADLNVWGQRAKYNHQCGSLDNLAESLDVLFKGMEDSKILTSFLQAYSRILATEQGKKHVASDLCADLLLKLTVCPLKIDIVVVKEQLFCMKHVLCNIIRDSDGDVTRTHTSAVVALAAFAYLLRGEELQLQDSASDLGESLGKLLKGYKPDTCSMQELRVACAALYLYALLMTQNEMWNETFKDWRSCFEFTAIVLKKTLQTEWPSGEERGATSESWRILLQQGLIVIDKFLEAASSHEPMKIYCRLQFSELLPLVAEIGVKDPLLWVQDTFWVNAMTRLMDNCKLRCTDTKGILEAMYTSCSAKMAGFLVGNANHKLLDTLEDLIQRAADEESYDVPEGGSSTGEVVPRGTFFEGEGVELLEDYIGGVSRHRNQDRS